MLANAVRRRRRPLSVPRPAAMMHGDRYRGTVASGPASCSPARTGKRRHQEADVTPALASLQSGPPGALARPVSQLIRAAGLRWPVEESFEFAKGAWAWTSPRCGSTPRSPGTPCWSWPPWRSAPSPPPCCATAPIPRAAAPVRPGQAPPANAGTIPLTVPEIGRLLTHPPPPGATTYWLDWRRRHRARSAWYHQRTRLTRDTKIAQVT